jgi:polyphenol oxidase
LILRSLLLSKIPGVKHGFSTRLTDVTTELGEVVKAKQVHSANVVDAREAKIKTIEADGLISIDEQLPVGIYTADCVPILIACTKGQAVAAVHAGWRGAVAKIVHAAIAALEKRNVQRSTLRFALGPSISLDAFEVGDEVIEAARASLDGRAPPAVRWDNGKYHLDLRALLVEQLQSLDIPRPHIELTGGCTLIESGLYHSYRRDHAGGRQLSAIALDQTKS